jgi:hypothetical protein
MVEMGADAITGPRLVPGDRVTGAEMTHYADGAMRILSRHNIITVEEGENWPARTQETVRVISRRFLARRLPRTLGSGRSNLCGRPGLSAS